jgi:hypothetical protein
METSPTDNTFTRCKVEGRREETQKRWFDTFSLLLSIWCCCGHDEHGEGAFGLDLGRLSRGLSGKCGGERGGGFVGKLSDETSGSDTRGLGIKHGIESADAKVDAGQRSSRSRRARGGTTRVA